MNILVVEDEAKSAAFLKRGLTEAGFSVEVAANGETGLQRAITGDYCVMILDIGLPQRDGWSVIADLRGRGRQIPVLFLTAHDAIADRVHGLELGADDYLVKPFAFSELLARVRTIMRRGQPAVLDRLEIANLEIDLLRQRVTRGGRRIDLTAMEFSLLTYLVRHAGEILSRRLLAEQVWDMRFESDTNVVEVGVRRLRAKIDDPFELKLIRTVRGIGYVCSCDY